MYMYVYMYIRTCTGIYVYMYIHVLFISTYYILQWLQLCRGLLILIEPFTTPIILDPEFLGSGNVRIIWTRPEGPVYGYLLFYELASGFGSEVMINIPSPNTTYYVISNLDAGATYTISIIAYADLPTEITDPVLVTLNGKNTHTHVTHTHACIHQCFW